jgi:Zn-dependent protease/predicted transcriptional regulator
VRGGFRLGKVLGFEVTVDYSWFIIFGLVLWSFSMSLLPEAVPGYSRAVYLVGGLVSALLLFASLLAHELAHSVVARAKGIPVDGITLFIFGGVARTRMEASSPGDEFQIAGVGPLSSFIIAVGFGALAIGGMRAGLPPILTVPAEYLGYLNLVLAIFNLLPGFPLDGGRLFRAILWKVTGNLTRATRIATLGGQWFGLGLIGWGALRAAQGVLMGGIWMMFIGWFLRNAARNSYRQHLVHAMLAGVKAEEVMTRLPTTIPPDIPIYDAMETYFGRSRFVAYPVAVGDRPVGIVTIFQVRETPESDWTWRPIEDVMTPIEERMTVAPDDAMMAALEKLQGSTLRRLLVVENGRLVGFLTANDVAGWLQKGRTA